MKEQFFKLFRSYPELKKCIVNLKSGTSFSCVVYKHSEPYLVLKNVSILSDMGKPVKSNLDNEVLVKINDIDFIQVL